MTPIERLHRYMTTHRIDPVAVYGVDGGGANKLYTQDKCAVDGIAIWKTKDGRWRHDHGEIVSLLDAAYGGLWPTGRSFRDEAERLVAREIVEEMDDEPEEVEDEWTNREGMPEFNGAF